MASYITWTFGSFSGVTWAQLRVFAPTIAAGILLAWLLAKPLNALLLGDGYARSMGVNVPRVRTWIILTASVLAGAVTAFCGPIGFLGIAVPHICRLLLKTTDHHVLVPAVVLVGAIIAMLADLLASAGHAMGPSLECDHRPHRRAGGYRRHPASSLRDGGRLMTDNAVMDIRGISIGYRQPQRPAHAVAGEITVSLHAGEFVCLLGPNGAGKSTLIRTLTGMQPPLAGSVLLEGRPVTAHTARELAQRMSLVLTQRVAVGIMPVMTLVALGRHPYTNGQVG